jgi:TRAP-type uncharacterized transport system substrate-binding protein
MVAVFICIITTSAQAQLIVSTGSPSGTYGTMFREINTECATDYKVVLNEWKDSKGSPSNGSVLNLDNLASNLTNVAFVQMDVMRARAITDERVNSLRILFPLHNEEVHFIVNRKGKKEGGVWGIGAKTVSFTSVKDLHGRTVGAWGGSFVTATYINGLTGLNMQLVEFQKESDGLAALKAGQIDGVLAVGGQPLAWIKGLSGAEYQLLTVDAESEGKLKNAYKVGTISYPNLGANTLKTFTTRAALVTRQYKTAEKVTALTALSRCLTEKIDKLGETTGYHPKWSSIDPAQKIDWPYFEGSPAKGK